MKRLVILDWGIGGLGFWKEWKGYRPEEGVGYFSDRGFEPYGKVSEGELVSRLKKVIGELKKRNGVSHCLLACNAASTVADQIRCEGVEVAGLIEAAVVGIQKAIPPGPVTVIGGVRTIESGLYEKLLPDHAVTGLVGQRLSAAVEAGQLEGAELRHLVREVVGATQGNLILACTHYVALAKVIREECPKVNLYDPVPEVAREYHKAWPGMGGEDWFETSGDFGEMKSAARSAFGVSVT